MSLTKNVDLINRLGLEPDIRLAEEFGVSRERINNNEGYNPHNCKWATMKEQCNNRRTPLFKKMKSHKTALASVGVVNHLIHSQGWTVTKTAKYLGIHWNTANRYKDIHE